MRFFELSQEAKDFAVQDYVDGWAETHPRDLVTPCEAFNALMYDCEELFDESGKVVEE